MKNDATDLIDDCAGLKALPDNVCADRVWFVVPQVKVLWPIS